jgi:hypothetical protein
MTNVLPATTYEGQLAAELLPDMAPPERLELLSVMDPDDMRTSLAFIISQYPQAFDFALVRDRAMIERLEARVGEDQADEDDDEEPYCCAVIAQAPGTPVPPVICNAAVGIFHGHGDGWHHYRGDGTADNPNELYDAGHEPVIAWREAVRNA